MTDNTNEETTNQNNIRRLAAERMRQLTALQFRQLRRGRPGGAPWRDPRNGQGRLLAVLKLKPEMTQRELTYLMGMSRQSIAELLRKLESQGLIEREASADDRRVVNVRLTEAGRSAVQDTEPDEDGRLGFLDCLTDDEVAQLADYLGRIIERLEQESGDDFDERSQRIQEFWHHHGRGPHPGGGFPGFGPDGFPGPDRFPGPDGFPGSEGPWGEGFTRSGRGERAGGGRRGGGPRGGRPTPPPPPMRPQDRHSADEFHEPEQPEG